MKNYISKFFVLVSLFSQMSFAASVVSSSFFAIDNAARSYSTSPTPPSYGSQINANAGQQNSIVNFQNYQFVFYVDQDDRPVVARRSLNSSTWLKIALTDVDPILGLDTHNTPSIAVDKDGRIHLAYGHHATPLRYRFSTAGAATASNLSLSSFYPERDYFNVNQPQSRVTYPRFIKADNDQLLIFWRDGVSGHGDLLMAKWQGNHWSGKFKIIDGSVDTYPAQTIPGNGNDIQTASVVASSKRSAYANDIRYEDGTIHLTWTWRERAQRQTLKDNPSTTQNECQNASPSCACPDQNKQCPVVLYNHDVMYVYSTDNGSTWNNSSGTRVMDFYNPISLHSPGIKQYSIGYGDSLINSQSQDVDQYGNLHVVLRHGELDLPGQAPRKYFHYVKVGSTFSQTPLVLPPVNGARPKVYADRNHAALAVYTVIGGINSSNPAKPHDRLQVYSKVLFSQWACAYKSSQAYENDTHGLISDDGTKMWILAQRKRTSTTQETARLEVIELTLDPTGTPSCPS